MDAAAIDLAAGVRASLALSVPALLGIATNLHLGTWASLGGFETSLADVGGPYSRRATTTLSTAFAGSLLVVLGTLAAAHPLLALPLTAFVAFSTAYLNVFGPEGRIVGNVLLTLFLCGTGASSLGHLGIQEALPCLVGGLWATFLSMALWPIHPHGPARSALGSCYRDFSRWLKDCQYLLSTGSASSGKWETLARVHQKRIQRITDKSRQFLTQTRWLRRSSSKRGDQMLVLLAVSDVLVDELTAMNYRLDALSRKEVDPEIVFEMRAAFTHMEEIVTYTAEQSSSDRRRAVPRRTLQAAEASLVVIEEIVAQDQQSKMSDLLEFIRLCRLLLADLRIAAISAYGIQTGEPEDLAKLRERQSVTSAVLKLFEEHWSPKSLVFRHAMRAAIVCSAALGVSMLLGLKHGYWAPLSAVMVLQPHSGLTLRKSAQRVVGTVMGAMIAVLLSLSLPSRAVMIAVLVPITLVTAAVRQASYSLYVLFLTPVFLLLAGTHAGDWHLAQVRAMDTVIGALIAVAGAWFLWPVWESPRFTQVLVSALQANADFLKEIAMPCDAVSGTRGRLSAARKKAAIANAEAEASLQRLIEESDDPSVITPSIELVSTLRRVTYRVNALVPLAYTPDFNTSPFAAHFRDISRQIADVAVILAPDQGTIAAATGFSAIRTGASPDKEEKEEDDDICAPTQDDQLPTLHRLVEIMSEAATSLRMSLSAAQTAKQP